MRDLALELLEFVDDVVDDLGSRAAVEYVHTILAEGTSADRQLRVFRETGGPAGRRRPRGLRDGEGAARLGLGLSGVGLPSYT